MLYVNAQKAPWRRSRDEEVVMAGLNAESFTESPEKINRLCDSTLFLNRSSSRLIDLFTLITLLSTLDPLKA